MRKEVNMLREINAQEAKNEIKTGKKLLVFHALYCALRKMYKSTLEELADKNGVEILRVNIEENKEFATESGVRAIPYTQVYQDGSMIKDLVGYRTYDDLLSELDSFLK
ncbi:thioredoxin family protein [Mycoplasmopsis cynos]|uniref:thioredoxin family protein n=2 Tax=Mycoplasmopsis cynos TaxID=171284 RepID=UPI0021FC8134|nr:thioredoxin family protein [Mycoplasmopsis cynos]UWV93585.1 thioredoxin family protein [Mycoplasmopsis cynos]WAM02968.1 thioredoxin family protein [Mycoplasmopsis cynos]